MVSEANARLFRRKDGKYLIYISKDLAEDSMFPFKGSDSIPLTIFFKPGGERKLVLIERKEEPGEGEPSLP